MSNGWKSGRVAHIFGLQLWGRIPTEQSQISLFITAVRFGSRFIAFLSELDAMG
jgi:hypothetical protein